MRKIVDTMVMVAPMNVRGATAINPETLRAALLNRYQEGWELFQSHVIGLDRASGDVQLVFVLVKYAESE